MGWMLLMLILDLDWVGPCKVTGDVLCPLSWGTPEPPSPMVAGQWHQLWMSPSNQTGRNEGASPLLPRRRTGLAGWPLWRSRTAQDWASHADFTCGLAWASCVEPWRAEELLCYRVVEEVSVRWEQLPCSACFSSPMSGSPVSVAFCVEGFWLCSVNRDLKQRFS